MRESGFRGKTLPGQSELVRAVTHIDPASLKCTSNQSIRSKRCQPARRRGRVRLGWALSRGASSGKRAIEQTAPVAAHSVTS
jgi:hypothetical protein